MEEAAELGNYLPLASSTGFGVPSARSSPKWSSCGARSNGGRRRRRGVVVAEAPPVGAPGPELPQPLQHLGRVAGHRLLAELVIGQAELLGDHQALIVARCGPSTGAGRGATRRGGGSAAASAWRTVRRWTW